MNMHPSDQRNDGAQPFRQRRAHSTPDPDAEPPPPNPNPDDVPPPAHAPVQEPTLPEPPIKAHPSPVS
jgi:hypothetical protein